MALLIGWVFQIRPTRLAMPTIYFTTAAIVLLTFIQSIATQTYHPRKALITILTVVYTMRLGIFLVNRTIKLGGSPPGKRKVRPLAFWIMVFFSPFVFALPVVFCNSPLALQGNLGILEVTASIVITLGIIIESIADHQKFTFRNDAKNNGKWCDIGLFKYSRYPHFFADLCVWWGVFVLSSPTLGGLKWVAMISPLYETYIILVADGVPRLQMLQDKKFGDNLKYVEYRNTTSSLIPCPPWLYKCLPFTGGFKMDN